MNHSLRYALAVFSILAFGLTAKADDKQHKEDTLNGANMGSGSSTATGTDTTGRGAPGYGEKKKSPHGTGIKHHGKASENSRGKGTHSDPTTGSQPEQ